MKEVGKRGPRTPAEPVDAKELATWLTGAQVTELGVTPRALSRWVESGMVHRQKDAAGQWRFKPDDIEAARTRGLPQGGARDEVIETIRALLGVAISHTERNFELVHEPGRRLLDLLQTENVRLAARCSELEKRHIEMLDLYEKLLLSQHTQTLETKMLEQREARKDRAFGKLSDALPAFLQQVFAASGAKRLVESIDDAQLQVLTLAEFLNDEQRALLKAEVARRAQKRAKAKEEQPAPNGAPTEEKQNG